MVKRLFAVMLATIGWTCCKCGKSNALKRDTCWNCGHEFCSDCTGDQAKLCQVTPGRVTLMKNNNVIKDRLLKLPLDPGEKVLLWLTFIGQKPVSDIHVLIRDKEKLRKGEFTSKNSDIESNLVEIKTWITDAGLIYEIEKEHPTAWRVGKDKTQIIKSIDYLHNSNKDKQIELGLIFGYPKNSVEAYVNNQETTYEQFIQIMIPPRGIEGENSEYFWPYAIFAISKSHQDEGVKLAKLWADIIRNDLPELAKLYESSN